MQANFNAAFRPRGFPNIAEVERNRAAFPMELFGRLVEAELARAVVEEEGEGQVGRMEGKVCGAEGGNGVVRRQKLVRFVSVG